LRAGYSKTTAEKKAQLWVGKSRQESMYPEMYDLVQEGLDKLTVKAGVTAQMVIDELASIAFAKGTDYSFFEEYEYEMQVPVQKKSEDDDDDNEVEFKTEKRIGTRVVIVPTSKIPEEKRTAIAGYKQTRNGVEVMVHDKVAALEKLGRYFKLFTDKVQHEVGDSFAEFLKQSSNG